MISSEDRIRRDRKHLTPAGEMWLTFGRCVKRESARPINEIWDVDQGLTSNCQCKAWTSIHSCHILPGKDRAMAQPHTIYGDGMPVDLMMAAGAGIILWVAFRLLNDFRKTGRVRPLVVAVVTLPVASFFWLSHSGSSEVIIPDRNCHG